MVNPPCGKPFETQICTVSSMSMIVLMSDVREMWQGPLSRLSLSVNLCHLTCTYKLQVHTVVFVCLYPL